MGSLISCSRLTNIWPERMPNGRVEPFEMSHAQTTLGKKNLSLPSKSDIAPAQLDAFHMESVSRLAHLPVVEESLKTASGFYGKVKV
ncbi:unnamed protein product, partial [Timema podura]|nr:unnamed protein product [Timema podura]